MDYPDLLIYRDGPYFAQLNLDENFNIDTDTCVFFDIEDGDSYANVQLNHLILAKKLDGGSTDLVWYLIKHDDLPSTIAEIKIDDLREIVQELCQDYLATSNKVN